MRRFTMTAVLAAVALFSPGCRLPGRAGADGHRIALVRPSDQTVRRGDPQKITFQVMCRNISEEVPVRFEHIPDGVKIVEKNRKLAKDEFYVNFLLCASSEADLVAGHQVSVTADCPDGVSVTESFTVTVKE